MFSATGWLTTRERLTREVVEVITRVYAGINVLEDVGREDDAIGREAGLIVVVFMLSSRCRSPNSPCSGHSRSSM